MLEYPLLNALASVLRTGSFELAAHSLSITPSAVSQRIKLLEERLGCVLIVRGHPCTATPAGARLFRHTEEVSLLEHTLATDLKGLLPDESIPTIRIAVNADSLATWFIDALAETTGMLFDLVTDDQDHSADLLRRREVMAAVTAHPGPVQGCDSQPLGALRYIAAASPAFAKLYFPDGLTEYAARHAPALTFNNKDKLQETWLHGQLGTLISFPTHMLPSSRGFVDAALAGLGWGMSPASLVKAHIASGSLVALGVKPALDVPLYWQSNRATRKALAPLTKAVRTAAKRYLIAC